MYTLDDQGLSLWFSTKVSIVIPFEDIVEIKKVGLIRSFFSGFNFTKPGISETYLGSTGDPFDFILVETRGARYLLRGFEIDRFIEETKARIIASRHKPR